MQPKTKNFLEFIGLTLGLIGAAIGGIILILIVSPVFWLAVIAITLIVCLT
jgi:hypothetical protein